MNLGTATQQENPLPPLRQDISLIEGASAFDGSPTWVIMDPVRGKYFQIGWTAYQLLSHWEQRTAERLVQHVGSTTTYRPTSADVDELIRFLYANHLTNAVPQGGFRAYATTADAAKQHWLMWLIHHYLFFQIPLVRPDRFLRATLPLVRPFYTAAAAWTIGVIGIVGLYLAARQWNTFSGTFLHFFTMEGAALYVLSLAGVKVFHELGHAYTATRYGCRVPTMGIACMVMVPMLYSDTSDAWRLRSRRQRALVGAAGMIVECALAALATCAWSFLDDGLVRSVVFIVATTSWMLGAAINLNPLMRFDGYYVLSDWLGIPNLQERAFAAGRWRLRQMLFGLGNPPPEPLTPTLRRILILYAWGTWIYRFLLFLGIAVLVYHFFFKLLGIVLFAIEIGWFILLPIAHEVTLWWEMRRSIEQGKRIWAVTAAASLVLAMVVVPWSNRLHLPAVLEAASYAAIYTPLPGKIVAVSVREGQAVREGVSLVRIDTPLLEKDLAVTRKRIEVQRLRAQREFATPEERVKNHVTLEGLRAQLSELEGLLERQRQLNLTAPFSGLVTDLAEGLRPGRWINKELSLAYVIDPAKVELHALVPETEVHRLAEGQRARFVPESPERPSLGAIVQEVRAIDETTFTVPYLASLYGGAIPVREDAMRKLKPESSVYRVTLHLEGAPPQWGQAVRGTVIVSGPPMSLARQAWERLARVLIRESSL